MIDSSDISANVPSPQFGSPDQYLSWLFELRLECGGWVALKDDWNGANWYTMVGVFGLNIETVHFVMFL